MRYRVDNIKNYKKFGGWICGYFLDDGMVQKNSDLEINISTFQPGHISSEHFHPKSKMVIIVSEGKIKMVFDGKEYILTKNHFVYLEEGVHESVIQIFEPTTVICIRTPSVPDNKVEV
jgi:mannose-6-phosphate isomerase-like protein (cupin superfamily)